VEIVKWQFEGLAGRLLKEIGELEQQKAKTQDKIEQPFTDEEIAAILADSRELAKTQEFFLEASDELKRRNLERYRVRVELEAPQTKSALHTSSAFWAARSWIFLIGKLSFQCAGAAAQVEDHIAGHQQRH
jgi:hypothetical protein